MVVLFFGSGLFFESRPVFAEEPIELKISHHGSTAWTPHKDVLEPWAKKIETLTNGRVHFTFYPKEALGKAKEQYDLAVKGTADIAASLPDYTPGRFPLTSVMQLPFLGLQSAEQSSIVVWQLYQKYLQEEYKETKLLWMFCVAPQTLHTTNKQVKTLEDIKGLRIGVSNPTVAKAIELLGAIPVVCTVTDCRTVLQEGKADGVALSWSGILEFKYLEFCKYHTDINIYTLPLFVTMNKEKYASLPADIQKIIAENSNEEMAVISGKAMDAQSAKARKTAEDRGDWIYTPPQQEQERWKKIAVAVGDQWVQEMKAKGLPGQEVLAYVVDLFIQLQK